MFNILKAILYIQGQYKDLEVFFLKLIKLLLMAAYEHVNYGNHFHGN